MVQHLMKIYIGVVRDLHTYIQVSRVRVCKLCFIYTQRYLYWHELCMNCVLADLCATVYYTRTFSRRTIVQVQPPPFFPVSLIVVVVIISTLSVVCAMFCDRNDCFCLVQLVVTFLNGRPCRCWYCNGKWYIQSQQMMHFITKSKIIKTAISFVGGKPWMLQNFSKCTSFQGIHAQHTAQQVFDLVAAFWVKTFIVLIFHS